MKLPAILLIGSLTVNAALLAVLLRREDNRLGGVACPPDGASAGVAQVSASATAMPWSALGPAALRTALHKTDLPREVVDALVLARIFARYEARRREFFAETLTAPWWQTAMVVVTGPTRDGLFTSAQRKELRDLEASARDEALRLLGPHALDPDGTIAGRHAFVAPEKAVLLDALLRDYQNISAALKDETGGLRTVADREREKFLEAERQHDLAALLTPQELERFELRTSPVAERLQWRLAGFDPTEAEYRAVFAVHKTFEEKNPGPVSVEGQVRRYDFSSVPEFNQQIREVLGDARFVDWKLAGQSHFRALTRLSPELGLAPETTKQIGALLSDTAARSWQIGENTALQVAEKRAALADMAAAARTEVTAKLGVAGAERYLRESVSWLELIATGNAVELRDAGGISYRPVDRPKRPPPRPTSAAPARGSPPAPIAPPPRN